MMTDSIYQYTPVFDVFKVHALKNVYVHTQCESNDEKEGGMRPTHGFPMRTRAVC
jgi:hypothetical protein